MPQMECCTWAGPVDAGDKTTGSRVLQATLLTTNIYKHARTLQGQAKTDACGKREDEASKIANCRDL